MIVSLPVRSLSPSLSLSPLFVSPAVSSLCLFLTHGPPRLPELSRCDCALIHAPRRFSASLRDVIAPHRRRQSSARPIAAHQPVHTHGHWWGYRRKVVRLTGTYLLRVRIKRTVTSEVSVNLPTSNQCAAFAEPPTKGLTVPAFKPSFSGCHMIIHRLVVPLWREIARAHITYVRTASRLIASGAPATLPAFRFLVLLCESLCTLS